MDNVNRDHYEVIGLPRDATQSEIDAACIRLAKKYHPDANPDDPLASKNFALIDAAYEILGSPLKKAAYDHALAMPSEVPAAVTPPDGTTPTEKVKQNFFIKIFAGGAAGLIGGLICIFIGSLLCVTIVGGIVGIPMIIIGIGLIVFGPALGFTSLGKAIEGLCPYCQTKVQTHPDNKGVTCSACKKRIVLRDNLFVRVD